MDSVRCEAFVRIRGYYERMNDRDGLFALNQLFKRHQRRCEPCRAGTGRSLK